MKDKELKSFLKILGYIGLGISLTMLYGLKQAAKASNYPNSNAMNYCNKCDKFYYYHLNSYNDICPNCFTRKN